MSLLDDMNALERHCRRGGTAQGWFNGTEKPIPQDARDEPIDPTATMQSGRAWEALRGD
jgi:hypothetical protein